MLLHDQLNTANGLIIHNVLWWIETAYVLLKSAKSNEHICWLELYIYICCYVGFILTFWFLPSPLSTLFPKGFYFKTFQNTPIFDTTNILCCTELKFDEKRSFCFKFTTCIWGIITFLTKFQVILFNPQKDFMEIILHGISCKTFGLFDIFFYP